jgi:hypothetical protein
MNFICFDTEDDSKELLDSGKSGFDKQTTQIAAIKGNGGKYYNRGNVKEFLRWLELQPERFIYAHNLQYDLGNLFGHQLDTLDCTLVGSRLIKAVWGKKCFVDSFNLWPMSAKKIGKAFGLEKLETDSMANDKAYVYRDVEIIHAAVSFVWRFAEQLQLKSVPSTLGGLAVAVWKAIGGENVHDSSALAREALFGGRVELFKVENESPSVAYTDINSLYPAVMRNPFPAQLEPQRELPDFGVARVLIRIPETDFPLLPVRDSNGRILYPYGTLAGVWTIAEIKAAVEAGATLLKVDEIMGTNESLQPYAGYVNKLYQIRLAATSDAEKLFFKLLMNNLYGRLGATGVLGRTVWQTEKNRCDGIPYGEKVLVNYAMPLSAEVNWSHAAYVTAYGRLALAGYVRQAGVPAMIYCDTDSCIFDCPSKLLPFPISTELGEMKLESWESVALTYAPKMYQIGKTYKAKGVPKRLQREYIEHGRAEYDLPYKFREAVAFFDRGNSKRLSVWRKVNKLNRVKYDKKELRGNRYFPCKVEMSLADCRNGC